MVAAWRCVVAAWTHGVTRSMRSRHSPPRHRQSGLARSSPRGDLSTAPEPNPLARRCPLGPRGAHFAAWLPRRGCPESPISAAIWPSRFRKKHPKIVEAKK